MIEMVNEISASLFSCVTSAASAMLPLKLRTVSGELAADRTMMPSSEPESKFHERREQVPSLHFGSPLLHVNPHDVPSHVGTARSLVTTQLVHDVARARPAAAVRSERVLERIAPQTLSACRG
jgi:hypothetical protein